jgi:[acyl-carrier-protein] S-malonyltransferase
MQSDLADAYPEVADTYAQASDIVGYDLWKLVQEGPAERLDKTDVTQPAMLAAGYAAYRCWQAAGGSPPGQVAGHSLGEYTALVAAGAIGFADALRIVMRRSELMQNAVPEGEGAMAALLGLDDDKVIDVCEEASTIGIAEPVNFNSPGQVVIAGHKSALRRTVELAKEAGARRAILLHVSVPSHSSLMRGAGEQLRDALDAADCRMPEIPVYNATDAQTYKDPDDIRVHLSRQVYSHVHWVNTIGAIITAGATSVIECGPGRVLTGLMRRIDRKIPAGYVDSPDSLDKALQL